MKSFFYPLTLIFLLLPSCFLVQPVSTTPKPTVSPIPDIGSDKTSEKDGMILLYVPAGEFTMGSDSSDQSDEKPEHQTELDAFWIDQTEVTNAMYEKCVAKGACKEPTNASSYTHSSYYGNSEFNDYPVLYVDRNMASAYCSRADRRLPTEAEWEKAARGTDANIYPWGNESPNEDLLNYNFNIGDTTKVGKYPEGKSIYGVLDMAGNVWEWVADWYDMYPGGDPNASTSFGQTYGVLRGGSWGDGGAKRSADRYRLDPMSSHFYIGFRCAMSATP